MTEEALLFFCDEAACKTNSLFYETFDMDDRWEIIRTILKVSRDAADSQLREAAEGFLDAMASPVAAHKGE